METLSIRAAAEDAGIRLDTFLASKAEQLSRSRVKALILEGAVAQDDEAVLDPRRSVAEGATYHIRLPEPVPATPEPEDIALEVLFEDEHLILINKPSGMAVHPAPGSWNGTLVNALLHHCRGSLSGIGGVERPGIVHRIDKLTTGVLVAAKTEPAHLSLSELFQKHDIERKYLAVTRGAPRPLSGTVDLPIARSTGDRKKMAVVRNPESGVGRNAVTHYRAIETFGVRDKGTALPAAALMECQLETGRTHQIRVHMAHIGAPLIGDPVYGRHKGISSYGHGEAHIAGTKAARKFPRQALHAAMLGFVHPITKEALRFEAPLPNDMAELIAALRQLPMGD
ncbi:MAG TPA: RluA family pseudouridine synthase [Hyphomonas atlantica]|uniref:Pseudouridine synthase n=1 Tax=Hyphomonas atlantica TaxID=1280948 RepID=A0A3B9L369_9PROT|nr:RluA family pseudouridine synthase [Hyphomonas atlantica]|tara:strand:+ start:6505 stop:7524 length:1020 start_codon:yes stop_codon:yes gene_type:complete